MNRSFFPPISRREMLRRAGGGFGGIALAGMLAEQAAAAAVPADPLAPRLGHFPARAKTVIFVFATGGASHVDTFDYKPKLYADHGKSLSADDPYGIKGVVKTYLKRPGWEFKRYGRAGTLVSDLFPHLGACADDLCVIRSMFGDSPGHDKATMGMHTGSFNFARPSVGAWVSYGLGTENRNLPAFVVLAPAPPYTGTQAWGADFLPGCHQGTWVSPGVSPGQEPVANVARRAASDDLQRMELDLLGQVNRKHRDAHAGAEAALDAQIRSFETAFGMQRAAPEAFDLSGESNETLELYGVKRGAAASKGGQGFAWQCLMARRLAERGVRFIELLDVGSSGNWDSHGDMADHAKLARNVDQPLAALIQDLKRRGMLDETLIVWTTEFGRTPFVTAKDAKGREHHNKAFATWLAGGGVRGGLSYGQSDDVGVGVAADGVHVHDLHATILHLLGLDHERLTYRSSGRDYRLTDVAGRVVKGIIA
jgi:hypothetical protein